MITERLSRSLSMAANKRRSATATTSTTEGFPQVQKDQIKSIIGEFWSLLEEDRDQPIDGVSLDELD